MGKPIFKVGLAVWLSLDPLLCLAHSVKATIDGRAGKYQFLERARQRWRLCAVLPHVHDHFFWAVAYGLTKQAHDLGVDLGVSEAGGYDRLPEQKRLIRQRADDGADAVLIAAINSTALGDELELLARRHIKIIDLVNGLAGKSVASHSHQDFSESGRLAARYALKIARDQATTIAWFPGPADARWAIDFDVAVRKTLAAGRNEPGALTLINGGWGAPYINAQSGLVRQIAKNGSLDIILANAPAAEFAARFFAARPFPPKIVSLYVTDGVIAEMRKGTISATVANSPVTEARIAVDLAVRVLQRQRVPETVSVPLRLITRDEIPAYIEDEAVAPSEVRMPLPKLPHQKSSP